MTTVFQGPEHAVLDGFANESKGHSEGATARGGVPSSRRVGGDHRTTCAGGAEMEVPKLPLRDPAFKLQDHSRSMQVQNGGPEDLKRGGHATAGRVDTR